MRYVGDFCECFTPEDEDGQDGTYFRHLEKRVVSTVVESDRDEVHEDRKKRAMLYIRANYKKLFKDEAYKKAYYMLIDESLRYNFSEADVSVVSDEERDIMSFVLDIQLSNIDNEDVEEYKGDAEYIVEWIRSGKELIVYV